MADPGGVLVDQLMRFRPDGLSPNGWAIRAGVSRTIWADLRRHGNPSRRTLEKLLGAAGSSLAEFEALRLGPRRVGVAADAQTFGDRNWGWKGPPLTPLPVADCAEAGVFDDGPLALWRIDRARELLQVPRPPSLAADADAFALIVPGNAMAPRFRTGRTIAVSPAMTVALGEDVLVRISDGTDHDAFDAIPGMLDALAADSVTIVQPGRGTGTIARAAVHSIAVIAGELF